MTEITAEDLRNQARDRQEMDWLALGSYPQRMQERLEWKAAGRIEDLEKQNLSLLHALMLVVRASGGKILVSPSHVALLPHLALSRCPDPQTGGEIFETFVGATR